MRRARPPRDERDILAVPVIPGAAPESPAGDAAPTASAQPRLVPVAAVAVALGLIVYGAVLLTRGPSRTHASSAPSTVAHVPAQTPVVQKPKPTPHRLARAAALKLAAKLPVSLESAALLRIGGSLYVVGGNTRHGGKPTNTVLRVGLATARVHSAGRFLEALSGAGSAARAGVLYLAGGWTGEKVASAVLRWSPGKAAAVVARLPVGLRSASAAFVGGRLYVTGGSPRRVFAVDIHSGTVVEAKSLPGALRKQSTNLAYLIQALR